MMRLRTFFLIAGSCLVIGCPRHIVVEPAEVDRLDADEWTILSRPGSAPAGVDAAGDETPAKSRASSGPANAGEK